MIKKYIPEIKKDDSEVMVKVVTLKGDKPTSQELIDLIKPLLEEYLDDARMQSILKPMIPEAVPGPQGEDYILTFKDKKEIAGKIKVPVIEKVKIVEQPIIHNNKIEKDISPADIRDKLESLKKGEKLSIEAIEELSDILDQLKKQLDKGTGKGRVGGISANSVLSSLRFVDDETLSGTKNDVNTIFTISKNPVVKSLKIYRNGQRMRITEDYTFAHKTVTFIIAPSSSEILLADYRY